MLPLAICIILYYLAPNTRSFLTGGDLLAIAGAVYGMLIIILVQGVFLGRSDARSFALADAAPGILLTVLSATLYFMESLTFNHALAAYGLSWSLTGIFAFALLVRTTKNINFKLAPLISMISMVGNLRFQCS